MQRRAILKTGAAILAGVPALNGCGGAKRNMLSPGNIAAETPDYLNRDNYTILRAASLAPSGHNTQPWNVDISDPARWIIRADPSRRLSAVDPRNRELILSIGAFIENLAVAARHIGRTAHMVPIASSPSDLNLATVTFTESAPDATPIETLLNRCTMRCPFHMGALSEEEYLGLTAYAPDRIRYYPPKTAGATWLDEATIASNRAQMNRDDASHELAEWIRWSDADARMKLDGLTPESMGITGFAGWYVRRFYKRESALTGSFRDRGMTGVCAQVGGHGGWLVITGNDDVAGLLDTGRLFERVFLGIRERGIAFHPMTQALEESPWKDSIQDELSLARPAQFIVRVGHIDSYPAPVSFRRPVAAFIRA